MLVYPSSASAAPHQLSPLAQASGGKTMSIKTPSSPRPRPATLPRPPRRTSPPSLHKQAALNASLRVMELEKQRQHEEQQRQQREAQREYERRQQLEAEWAEENQEVSIIVTRWDDDAQCWYPIEARGPVGRELRMFLERRKRMGERRK